MDYERKYKELNKKYRAMYTQYKNHSSRASKLRVKYLEIIHMLQAQIVNQTEDVESMLKAVEEMAEIERII